MKKKDAVLGLIKIINLELEKGRPSREEMLEELKMMRFKVRSLFGNIFELSERRIEFLESLWKIGKIEEAVFKVLAKLNNQEKAIFFRYLEDLQGKLREKISSLMKKVPSYEIENMKTLEIEIFKERIFGKKNLN